MLTNYDCRGAISGINVALLVPLSTMTSLLGIVTVVGCKIVNLRDGCWHTNITAKRTETEFDKQDTTGLFPGFSNNSNNKNNTIL
jgi:hypothetical protein